MVQLRTNYRLYGRLFKYVKPYFYVLMLGLAATAVFSWVDAGATYLIKPLVNDGFINQKAALIRFAPLFILCAFILRSIANFVSNYAMTWVARIVVMQLRQEMFSKLLVLPASYFDQHSSGRILSKLLYDVECVAQVSSDAVSEFVQNFFFIIGLLAVMLSISWKLSVIYFTTTPLILLVVSVINKRIRRLSQTAQKAMGGLTEIAEETIEGYTVVRMFSGQDYERNKFKAATALSFRYDLKLVVSRSVSVSLVQLIASLCIASIVYLAITPGYSTVLSAGGFASMIAAMLALLKPIKSLTKVSADLQKGLAGAQSVFQFLDLIEEPNEGGLFLTKRLAGHIQFKSVRFQYTEKTPWVLNQINLDVKAGTVLALVGKSGSGKTTLIKLLTRLYHLKLGQIMIDGIDIKDLSLKSLRANIAIVSQHVVLFNGTVRDNIAYGMGDSVTEDALLNAAKAAHADEFITQLPKGFDTVVGENGVLLSGGQRQRIAIARALLKDAPILILDEATSALDTESERLIQDALEKLMKDRTTFVIAHRLSTIEKADSIAVIDKGIVLEQGSHDELIQKNGAYARLHAMNLNENKNHTLYQETLV